MPKHPGNPKDPRPLVQQAGGQRMPEAVAAVMSAIGIDARIQKGCADGR